MNGSITACVCNLRATANTLTSVLTFVCICILPYPGAPPQMMDPGGKGGGKRWRARRGNGLMEETPYLSGDSLRPHSLIQEMDFLSAGNPCDGFK